MGRGQLQGQKSWSSRSIATGGGEIEIYKEGNWERCILKLNGSGKKRRRRVTGSDSWPHP